MMNVKDVRISTGLSQSKFAEKYGFPVRTLQGWEAGKEMPPYVLSLIAQRVALDGVRVTAWVFTEYSDAFGSGSTKIFKTEQEALEYAHDVWDHKNAHDRARYKAENGDWFGYGEFEMMWDDDDFEYEPYMDAFSLKGSPLTEDW